MFHYFLLANHKIFPQNAFSFNVYMPKKKAEYLYLKLEFLFLQLKLSYLCYLLLLSTLRKPLLVRMWTIQVVRIGRSWCGNSQPIPSFCSLPPANPVHTTRIDFITHSYPLTRRIVSKVYTKYNAHTPHYLHFIDSYWANGQLS